MKFWFSRSRPKLVEWLLVFPVPVPNYGNGFLYFPFPSQTPEKTFSVFLFLSRNAKSGYHSWLEYTTVITLHTTHHTTYSSSISHKCYPSRNLIWGEYNTVITSQISTSHIANSTSYILFHKQNPLECDTDTTSLITLPNNTSHVTHHTLYQASLDLVKVCPTSFLLWHNLHMFLDILELRVERKTVEKKLFW